MWWICCTDYELKIINNLHSNTRGWSFQKANHMLWKWYVQKNKHAVDVDFQPFNA